MAHGIKLDTLTMEDLQSLISDAQKALSVKVSAERSELIKKLEALDAIDRPIKGTNSDGPRKRGSKKTEYRGPSGREYANTGSIPKEFRDLGVTDKAGMEPYRIKD